MPVRLPPRLPSLPTSPIPPSPPYPPATHIQPLQPRTLSALSRSAARLPPRIVSLPRYAPVAAIIPGDSTAELVLTNGLYNFL